MTDRFHQPEGAAPGDPRRIFIPAPTGPPGSDRGGAGAGTGAPAPPGPPRVVVPAPGRPPAPPGGPGRPDGRAPLPGRRGGGDRPPPGPPDGGTGRRLPRPGRPRLRARRVLLVLAILVVLGLVGTFLWARSVFNRIERVETESTLSAGGLGEGTNYLIVGSDSRDPIEGEQGGFTDGQFPGGQRSDTMMVLHVGGGGAKMLSIPRDLYVPIAGTGESQKINAAFNGGAPRLISTVQQNLDIPIHRYVEVDFVSFGGLVDALGGVTVNFPHPATDPASGLNVTQSGPVELDGEQALAYVRSRNYTEHIDGEQRVDGTGDLGRIQRQQAFLQAVMGKLSDTKNPLALARVASRTAGGLRIDDEMGMFDAARLLWTLRNGLDPAPLVLPVDNDRNESGSVLILREDEAQAVLDEVR